MQALRCPIAIQDTLCAQDDGLRLRIGVRQGEVVAEGDDLMGDGVIIAARLEPLAEPGGICISSRVREDASGKTALEVDDLGEPELKKIATKIRVFRGRLSAAERPPLPLPDKPSLVVPGRLVDVASWAHLWADRFDGGLEDVFDLQDQVNASVVAAIELNLRTAEI